MPQANRDNNSLQLLLDSLLELSTLGNVIIDQVDAALDLNEEVRSSMLRDTSKEGSYGRWLFDTKSPGKDCISPKNLLSSLLNEYQDTEQHDQNNVTCSICDSHRITVTSERDTQGRNSYVYPYPHHDPLVRSPLDPAAATMTTPIFSPWDRRRSGGVTPSPNRQHVSSRLCVVSPIREATWMEGMASREARRRATSHQ